MQRVKVVQETSASLADVWSTLTDFAEWATWGPWDRSEVEPRGSDAIGGVGAIRRLHVGRRVLREETTLFEPERELRYRVVSGIPVRDYEGVVVLEQIATKVRITWSSSFHGKPAFLGPIIRRSLQSKFAEIASSLARAAEVKAATSAESG